MAIAMIPWVSQRHSIASASPHALWASFSLSSLKSTNSRIDPGSAGLRINLATLFGLMSAHRNVIATCEREMLFMADLATAPQLLRLMIRLFQGSSDLFKPLQARTCTHKLSSTVIGSYSVRLPCLAAAGRVSDCATRAIARITPGRGAKSVSWRSKAALPVLSCNRSPLEA